MGRDVHICEAGPRAGSQDLAVLFPTSIKCDLIFPARSIEPRLLTGRLNEAGFPKAVRRAAL